MKKPAKQAIYGGNHKKWTARLKRQRGTHDVPTTIQNISEILPSSLAKSTGTVKNEFWLL
ncbi:hypothetical protein [Christensenella tenuis]|jgi:hypothetical protein|uniref:Uncharacterized protein n=1 Tax=Christensenella tenuis TaxID=2763033 RepID=A0ABR7ECG7_9FIRM|nr:hypothetical protein [Christensenella tenuis]MBC5647472.1 hypothetical protein [Christensenella tenuis]